MFSLWCKPSTLQHLYNFKNDKSALSRARGGHLLCCTLVVGSLPRWRVARGCVERVESGPGESTFPTITVYLLRASSSVLPFFAPGCTRAAAGLAPASGKLIQAEYFRTGHLQLRDVVRDSYVFACVFCTMLCAIYRRDGGKHNLLGICDRLLTNVEILASPRPLLCSPPSDTLCCDLRREGCAQCTKNLHTTVCVGVRWRPPAVRIFLALTRTNFVVY